MAILDINKEQWLLKKSHLKGLPKRVIYFDTETAQQQTKNIIKHRMKIAWSCRVAYDRQGQPKKEQWLLWHDTETLCKYFAEQTSSKESLYIIGHNVFFDLQVSDFFYYYTRWGWTLDYVYEKGLVYILVLKKGKRTIICLSSTNYFDFSLEKVGQFLGLEKLEIDFESEDEYRLIVYCRRDVEIVKGAMEYLFQFIHEHDLGQFKYTRASMSFTSFRHRFMEAKIYLHKDERVKQLERKAYHGGRVECFEVGEIKDGPFVTLDINSEYPYVMSMNEYPTKLVSYRNNVSLEALQDIVNGYCCVGQVILETESPIYAIKHNGKLIFPVGSFRAYLCTRGLEEALKRGHIKTVEYLAVYQSDYIFKPFIDFFYGLKEQYSKEGNTVLLRMTKIIMNSLYGKFGQKRTLNYIVDDITYDGYWRMETLDLVTGASEIEYKLLNRRVREYGQAEGKQAFPAIAAHVTEDARLLLWNIIETTGRDKVLYCDTDSIKIRKRDLPCVKYPIDPHSLGTLKIEDESRELTLISPKCYITEHERVLKGVPKHAIGIGPYKYKYLTFLKQASHLRHEVTRYFVTQETIKLVNQKYDKGIVQDDGKVIPFRFEFHETLV